MDLLVENVGGIDDTELTIGDVPTLITGRNASNKTSLLQALLFALGKDDDPTRTGTDRARVRLTIDGTIKEDTVGNFAESEPSTIGLVLGLAGYLAYDVDTTSPVLALDSLGRSTLTV